MSDISNVLRKVIELDISLGLDGTQEALDEITRLTAEVERLTEQKIALIGEIDRLRTPQRTVLVEQGESVARLTAEVERLRSLTVVQESLIRKSEAANEKLRAALEPFVCDCKSNCEWERDEICPDWNARAALSGDKQ